eukprot:UC4_evm1s1205
MVKVAGLALTATANLPAGKEGPLIHIGACVAAALTQMKSSTFGFDSGFIMFRSDRNKRDFIAAGAAAGVAAAFSAPVGGVLFFLEEGGSYFNQVLIWRVMVTGLVATATVNFFLRGINAGEWGDLSDQSIVAFGDFSKEIILWEIQDLFIFALIGALGGCLGALWNQLHIKLTTFRLKHMTTKNLKMFECVFVAFCATALYFLAAMSLGECDVWANVRAGGNKGTETRPLGLRSFYCSNPEKEFNDMATLAFNPMGATVRSLLHLDGAFSPLTLFVYFLLNFFMGMWIYGSMVPSGVFIPTLVSGAAMGRLIGELIVRNTTYKINTTSYALIGAAAMLGGVSRMTLSLTVILMEGTNQIQLGLPILVTLYAAKFVGDKFSDGLFNMHILLKHIPLLEWSHMEQMKRYQVKDIMTPSVVCLNNISKVRDVVNTLAGNTHNGFPVVIPTKDSDGKECNKLVGIILRHQIITLLENRIFGPIREEGEDVSVNAPLLPHDKFLQAYPQRRKIQTLNFYDAPPSSGDMHETSLNRTDISDLDMFIDIGAYCHQAPCIIRPSTGMFKAYEYYRAMALRHIIVVNNDMEPVGIITSKELVPNNVFRLERSFINQE